MRRASGVAVLVLATVACRGQDRPASEGHPRDPELRRMIARALSMHDGLAAAASRAGRDCAAMASGLAAAIEEHRDVLAIPAALEAEPELRTRFDQLVGEVGEQLAAVVTRFGKAIAPCAADPQVGAALAPLESGDPLRAD